MKITNKRKKLLIFGLLFTIVVLSSLKFNAIKVNAESNYSNYLTNESISVKNDRALILLEPSSSANNYRNYFETGFLFPSKLRDNMYSTHLTTNPAKYYVSQTYLSDLDSEYAFSDVENLGQYETNSYIENYTDITENSGNYKETKSNEYEYLKPNSDIITDWHSTDSTFYTEIDDYSGLNNNDYIYADPTDDSDIIEFGLTDKCNGKINQITIYTVQKWFSDGITNHYHVRLYNGSYTSYQTIDIGNYNLWREKTTIFNGIFYNISNLKIQYKAPNWISGGFGFLISRVYVKVRYVQSNNVLESFDNNYYNYEYNITGNGNFTSTYSFENDANGSNPSDFTTLETGGTVQVISDLDSHNKVVELYDTSATSNMNPYLNQDFSSQTSGTIEYWVRTTDTTKKSYYRISNNEGYGVLLGIYNDKFYYYSGTNPYQISGINALDNIWYHFRIDFECGAGAYKGLSADKYDVYINQIKNVSSASFFAVQTSLNRFRDYGQLSTLHYFYIDALDYSWSSGYYHYRNYLDYTTKLNLTSNLEINSIGNNYDNLEKLNFEYIFKSNISCNLYLYFKNINSNNYDLIHTNSLTTNFQDFNYLFSLNYTYYSTLGIVDFMFYVNNTNNVLISIDKINLKSIFSNFSINNNGFHDISIKFNRKTSGGTNRGNITFDMKLYKDYFSYDYIENNVIETDYSKTNQIVNFSNDIDDIIECEIQSHIRYGLNTLDIDITNIYYLVIINYNYTFELFEQLRFGNNDGNYYRYEFSYSSMNFNRLNNTGIFGNYSSNCLSGIRVLRGSTSQNYNRYFLIPYFDEKVNLNYAPSGVSGSGSGSEPSYPSSKYWEYETFKLSEYTNKPITVENWTVDYKQVQSEKYNAKFFYREKTIHRRELGSWEFKITDTFKVSFNFIRNALCDIINLVLLFFQYIFFLVTASFSYIFMYLGTNIMVLIWNTILYYLFFALIWIIWYIYLGLYLAIYYIWLGIIWFYENYLIPFFEWFWYVAIPWMIDFLIIILAHIITLIIYLITLGDIDYDIVYTEVYMILRYVADEIIEMILVFIYYIDYIFLFILYYLLLTGMLYMRYIYCKARGFNNRAKQLHNAFEVFSLPIRIVLDLFKDMSNIKQTINPQT